MGRLLERETELHAVDAALADAAAGRVSIVFVAGEPGIGKTSILGAARERARDRGFRTRSAVFTPLSASGSYALLWDWFPEAASDEASTVFDGPASLIPAALQGGEAGDAPALAYAAQWAVSALAAAHPQLLVVDDLHWADEASLRLLAALALRLRGERVALLVASRPLPDAGGTVSSVIASPATRLLAPGPLSPEAVAELAADAASADPAEIHRLSGGVPFYVRELLDTGASAAPARVVHSLLARLAALPAATRRVAETLAVAAAPLAHAVLARAVGQTRAELRTRLAELETAAIAAAGGTEAAILHPIVTEGIVSGLDDDRRATAHERIAAAMRAEDLPVSALAAHELHAAPSGDPDRVEVLRAAGRLADAAGSPATAAGYYARASREGGIPETERIELVFAEGRARTIAGDGASGIELIGEVIGRLPDPVARGARWAQLGDLAYMAGNIEVSTTAYERARAALREDTSESEEGRLILAKILANEVTYRPGTAGTVLELAEEAAARAGDGIDRADAALHAVAALSMVLSEGVGERSRAAAERARSAGLAPGGSDDPITYMLSGALNYLAMFDEAEEWLGLALDDARDRGSVFGFATASYARGGLRFRFGRIRSALADLEASWASIGLGWHTYFYAIRHYLVLGLLRTGEIERATEVAATPPQGPEPAFPAIGRMTQVVVHLARGDLDAAVAHADALAAEPNPMAQAGIEWRTSIAEAYTRRGLPGDGDRARLLIHEALEQIGPTALPLHRAAIMLDAAALTRGDEAEALYTQVLALCGEDPVYEAAAARLALARIEADRGRSGAARKLARTALGYAIAEGVRPLAHEAYELLASIDPAPSLAGPEQRLSLLSPSELRIASAAAGGRSNREIAREQFVTMRTVEFHLTNVYRKLAISSREELGRLLAPIRTDV